MILLKERFQIELAKKQIIKKTKQESSFCLVVDKETQPMSVNMYMQNPANTTKPNSVWPYPIKPQPGWPNPCVPSHPKPNQTQLNPQPNPTKPNQTQLNPASPTQTQTKLNLTYSYQTQANPTQPG